MKETLLTIALMAAVSAPCVAEETASAPTTKRPMAVRVQAKTDLEQTAKEKLLQGLVEYSRFYNPTGIDRRILFVDAVCLESKDVSKQVSCSFSLGVALNRNNESIAVYRMTALISTTEELLLDPSSSFVPLWESFDNSMKDEIGAVTSELMRYCRETQETRDLWTENSNSASTTNAQPESDAYGTQPVR